MRWENEEEDGGPSKDRSGPVHPIPSFVLSSFFLSSPTGNTGSANQGGTAEMQIGTSQGHVEMLASALASCKTPNSVPLFTAHHNKKRGEGRQNRGGPHHKEAFSFGQFFLSSPKLGREKEEEGGVWKKLVMREECDEVGE